MADHIVEQIMAKVKTLLSTSVGNVWPTDADGDIFRNRTLVIPEATQFPVINQLQGPVRPLAGRDGYLNVRYQDSEVEVYLDLVVASVDAGGETSETQLNQLWKQCHQTLLANGVTTLGLSFVHVIFPTGSEEPVVHSETDRQYVTMRTSWAVRFRTNLADPTQVS